MKRWMILLTIGTWVCLTMSLSAQDEAPAPIEGEFDRLGQSSFSFLDIEVGARPVAMGGAFTTMDNDVVSLFWNPAGIAKIKDGALSINHIQWIADINQYAFATAFGFGNIGTFGASFLMMDNGSIERTIPSEDIESHPEGFFVDGTFNVVQWAAGLCYARQITDKFSIGAQIKYVYENLGDADIAEPAFDTTGAFSELTLIEDAKNRENAVAFDFGTLYYFGVKDLRIGMSYRNFGKRVTYAFESFNLPTIFKLSIAMNVLSLLPQMDGQELQVVLAAINPYDGGERIHLGAEYLFKKLLALRAGYRSNVDTGSYSVGFGLLPGAITGINLMIDYAYSDADKVFGSIHRFSFGFRF